MNYYNIGCRSSSFDWIWIVLPEGFRRMRALKSTHEIAWPKKDKYFPSGRFEQDTGRLSVCIPPEIDWSSINLSGKDQLIELIKKTGFDVKDIFYFDRKD